MCTQSGHKGPSGRQRVSRGGHSRAGCKRCKRMHLKCDEASPACLRCIKADAVCDYAFAKAPPIQVRRLMPAPSQIPRSPGLLSDLTAGEIFYYHRFQSHIASAFSKRGHPAGFWSRTAPRDGLQDPCIRQCLVALGALDCALESYAVTATPGPKVALHQAMSHSLRLGETQRHLTQATLSYTKALKLLRLRLSQASHGGLLGPGEAASLADDWRTSRTALVSSVLFVLYETMQGNTEAVHRINTTFIKAYEQKLLRNLDLSDTQPECPWRTTAGLDDFGIDEGSHFLLRKAALRGLMGPQFQESSTHQYIDRRLPHDRVCFARLRHPTIFDDLPEVVALWSKTRTATLVWLHHTNLLLAADHHYDLATVPPAALLAARAEQDTAITHCQRFVEVAQHHLSQPNDDDDNAVRRARRQVWTFAHTGALVVRLLAQAALDPAGETWDRHARECEAVLASLAAALAPPAQPGGDGRGNNRRVVGADMAGGRSATAATTALATGTTTAAPPAAAAAAASDFAASVVDDELYYILYFVVMRCRDARVRRAGLRLGRRVPYRTNTATTMTTSTASTAGAGPGRGAGGGAGEDAGGCVIWETLASLMRLEALCELEKRAREQGVEEEEEQDTSDAGDWGDGTMMKERTGGIPVAARYVPVRCWWDDEMKVLSIANRRVGVGRDEVVRVSVVEFERLRGFDPDHEEGKVRFEA